MKGGVRHEAQKVEGELVRISLASGQTFCIQFLGVGQAGGGVWEPSSPPSRHCPNSSYIQVSP